MTNKLLAAALGLALTLTLFCTTAFAQQKPSFDCNKAATPTEKAICSNANLAELDNKLAKIYSETLSKAKNSDEKKNMQEKQKEWLKKRNSCSSDIQCLKKSYESRILVPVGYSLFDELRGDLNGNGADDLVLTIKANTVDDYLGIMIFFKDGDDYRLAFENRRYFNTEFVSPSFKINRGNLNISFNGNGTCNIHEWSYVFKYRNSEFELIGYDANNVDCGGWNEEHTMREGGSSSKESINFLTNKRMTKVNNDKEVWDKITSKGPILLREIDMGNFNIDNYINK